MAFGKDPQAPVHPAHKTGNHRFAGAGVPGKHHVQGKVRRREALFLALLHDGHVVDQTVDLGLDGIKADISVKLRLEILDLFRRLRRFFRLFRLGLLLRLRDLAVQHRSFRQRNLGEGPGALLVFPLQLPRHLFQGIGALLHQAHQLVRTLFQAEKGIARRGLAANVPASFRLRRYAEAQLRGRTPEVFSSLLKLRFRPVVDDHIL